MNHTFFLTDKPNTADHAAFALFAYYTEVHRSVTFQLADVDLETTAYIVRITEDEDQFHLDNIDNVLGIYKRKFKVRQGYDYWEDKVKGR